MLGQLADLASKKAVYQEAVQTFANDRLTTLVLVDRPEETPLNEAARASQELSAIGVERKDVQIGNDFARHLYIKGLIA